MAYQEWMSKIKEGDVLIDKNNNCRIVRYVKHKPPYRIGYPPRIWVAFAIKRCSWTTRATTIMSASDLSSRGFKPLGINIKLNSALDKQIKQDVGKFLPQVKTHCCDVKGLY